MRLLGREKEVALLEALHQSKQAEFLAVYGRRRVGKTFLIKQTFKDKKDALFFSVSGLQKGKMKLQIANFTDRIGEVFYGGIKLAYAKEWRDTFKTLKEAIDKTDKKKVVIFLDELPWMATNKSRLLETLDYYWNEYWSLDRKIKLIICGSWAAWIIKKIINNTGGLHNRITEKLMLKPFDLYNTKKYLASNDIRLDDKQILLLYMVTGGVPYYLSRIKWKASAMQIIEKLAFSEKAFLLEEFEALFSSLFKDYKTYMTLCVLYLKVDMVWVKVSY